MKYDSFPKVAIYHVAFVRLAFLVKTRLISFPQLNEYAAARD